MNQNEGDSGIPVDSFRQETALTEELLNVMKRRASALDKAAPDATDFWTSPSFKGWSGLVTTSRKSALAQRHKAFLDEWHSTLQDLRDIGELVKRNENRPKWINESTPAGAQADQFLHAHYYQRTFLDRKTQYALLYEKNKTRRAAALQEAIDWWKNLPTAPSYEDDMLNTTAPFLKESLSEEALNHLNENAFREICMHIHAIKDYARRVPNKAVGLADIGKKYDIPTKVHALSKRIWNSQTADGKNVGSVLKRIIYEGPDERLPERLWRSVVEPKWKMEGLGISALGELVGWARPEKFPPRNGRTSKALKSLGYDVKIHAE